MEGKHPFGNKWDQLVDLGVQYKIFDIDNAFELTENQIIWAKEKSQLYELVEPFDAMVITLATGFYKGMVNNKLSAGDEDLNPFDELLHQCFKEALVKFPKRQNQFLFRRDTIGCSSEINDVLEWWRGNQNRIVEIPWFMAVSDFLWEYEAVNWEIELNATTNAHYVAELSSNQVLEKESIFLKGSKFEVLDVIEPNEGKLLVKLKEVDIGIVPDCTLYSNSYYSVSKGNKREEYCDEEPGLFD